MFHHSSQDYTEAASAAAKVARVKLDEMIQRGLKGAEAVVERVRSTVITDDVVAAKNLGLTVSGEGDLRRAKITHGPSVTTSELALHPHGFDQLLEAADLPKTFHNSVVKRAGGKIWGKELIAHNVNTMLSHSPARHLIRAEGDTVKGVLSDKFRRLDSRPLIDAFMGAATGLGLVPVEGVASDTKVRLRALLPKVFEPIDTEVMVFGIEWGNSDYGDGGHVVNLFTTRIVCTNLAITDQMLRQVHLGKRLDDNIEYSRRTYELDTKTNVSALADTVRHALNPQRVGLMLESIKRASADEIKGKDGIGDLLKKALSKTELEQVRALYDGPDVVNLPAGNTKWRLSNALSFFAQAKSVSADRKIELQHLAGALVPHKAHKPLEV